MKAMDHINIVQQVQPTGPDEPNEVKELLGYCIKQFEDARGRKNRRLLHRDKIENNLIQSVQLIDAILEQNRKLKEELTAEKKKKKKPKKKAKKKPRKVK